MHTVGIMGAPKKPDIREKDLHGFKHFKLLLPVLAKLHDDGGGRDRAGNRKLHFDAYVALILLYFFNPIVSSLRGIQQASALKKVQRILGCPRAALQRVKEPRAHSPRDSSRTNGVTSDGDIAQAEACGCLSTPLLDYYYPTSVLITARCIITLVDGSLLPAHQRDGSTADLQAALQACVSNLDFAELIARAQSKLA